MLLQGGEIEPMRRPTVRLDLKKKASKNDSPMISARSIHSENE